MTIIFIQRSGFDTWHDINTTYLAVYKSCLAMDQALHKSDPGVYSSTTCNDTNFPIPHLIRVRRKRDKTYEKKSGNIKQYVNVIHYCCYCSVTKSCLTLLRPH